MKSNESVRKSCTLPCSEAWDFLNIPHYLLASAALINRGMG